MPGPDAPTAAEAPAKKKSARRRKAKDPAKRSGSIKTKKAETEAKTEASVADKNGAGLTSVAFAQAMPWFPYVLSVAVVLFAFSTMISWSYYGERCWSWLFGDGSGVIYKIIFLVFTFAGSIVTASNVLDFGDLMILGMALPNILGVLFLSGKVKTALTEYMGKLKAGEFKEFHQRLED